MYFELPNSPSVASHKKQESMCVTQKTSGVSRVSLGALDPKRRPSPEPRQYVCRGVSKVFQRSSDFVASSIQDMMPRTPTKIKQTGFLAGWNSPSPPPRAAPRPVIAPVVPVPVVFTRTVNRRSPSPPATPRYCPLPCRSSKCL